MVNVALLAGAGLELAPLVVAGVAAPDDVVVVAPEDVVVEVAAVEVALVGAVEAAGGVVPGARLTTEGATAELVTTAEVEMAVVETVGRTSGVTTFTPAAWATVTEAGALTVAEARASAQPAKAAAAATAMRRTRFIAGGLEQKFVTRS